MPLCPSTTLLLPDRYYVVVANAAARPTGVALFTGMMIYQADIGAALRWNGTFWYRLGEYGFHVTRSTSDAAILTGANDDITFNTLQRSTGFIGSFSTVDNFTVPADGAGVYAVAGEVYWTAGLAGVSVSITKNAAIAIAQSGTASVIEDRGVVSGLGYLAAGDVIRLHVSNGSGSTITPAAFSGDPVSPILPYLAAWRIGD